MSNLQYQFRELRVKLKNKLDTEIAKDLGLAAKNLIADAIASKGYHDVTGNLREGITVGVYLRGALRYQVQEDASPPTRPTLAKGERYDLPAYWGGDDVGENPFVGKTGTGGKLGPAEGTKFVKRFSVSNSQWSIVVVAPVEYAGYVESQVNVLLSTYESAPGTVEALLRNIF